MIRWIKKIFAALSFALPDFHYGKDETSYDARNVEPIESKRVRYAPGGALEEVRKHYGVTIAGGPGSQKIGETFDALPQWKKDEFLALRKGKIRQARPFEDDRQEEGPVRRISWPRIARGLDKVMKEKRK